NPNSQGNPNDGKSPPRSPFSFSTNPEFGMPITSMANLFSHQYMENPPRFPLHTQEWGTKVRGQQLRP
ncbi:hypothetical protein A2U01_0114302, partial [Trifolium medium]|nr:hypothetical protein [Trifolium medium]